MKSCVFGVNSSLQYVDDLLVFIEHAERKIKKARNWSIFDFFCGLIFCDYMKYSYLKIAGYFIEEINERMLRLRYVFSGWNISLLDEININRRVVLFDYFLIINPFVSVLVTSKLSTSLKQVYELKQKISLLKLCLENNYYRELNY